MTGPIATAKREPARPRTPPREGACARPFSALMPRVGQCACGGQCPRCRAGAQRKANGQGADAAPAPASAPASLTPTPTPARASRMPAALQTGLERLSGFNLSHIQVHRNSSKPAQVDALAYTHGHEIFLAPGEERQLPHEGWHAVQQMQGRVRPTRQLNDTPLNDDGALEREADVMGAKALRAPSASGNDFGPAGGARAFVPTTLTARAVQRQTGGTTTRVSVQSTGNCSVANGNELGTAAVLAAQWLRTAIQALHRYEALPMSDSTAATRTALQFHFHTTNPFHAALIRTRLAQVRDGLDSPRGAPSDCAATGDTGCGDETVAYHHRGRIVWCPYFFGRDSARQAKTIIHEYTHAEARRLPLTAGFAEFSDGTPRHINDRAYLDRRYYLDLSPEEAMDNADSFANLVADLGTGLPITQSPSARAQDVMAGCAPGAHETIRQSLSMSARWNDAALDMLSVDAATMPTWHGMATGAITANFGGSPPTRAALWAIYDAAATPLIFGMRLECDGARGNCQSPITRLWHEGMRGAIHVCPGWIADGDALSRHRMLYQSVLSNFVRLPGNPWRYVDLARDLERRSDLDRPLPSLPSDPFPQSTEPGTAIG